jgi:hypothetical protein
MDGKFLKNLIQITNTKISNEIEENKMYEFNELPQILVDKNILLQKIQEKFGIEYGNYIISKTYDDNLNKVNPIKILEVIKNFSENKK